MPDDADDPTADPFPKSREAAGADVGPIQTDGEGTRTTLTDPRTRRDRGLEPAEWDDEEPLEEEEELVGMAYGGRLDRRMSFDTSVTTPLSEIPARKDIRWHDLREHYSPLRSLFKLKESSYKSFQRQLTQAWVDDTYDRFLERIVERMLVILGVALLVGVLVAGALVGVSAAGYLPRALSDLGVSVTALAATVFAGCASLGVLASGSYWAYHRVFRIRQRIAQRRLEIDYNLPYAVTFMYALSRAGVGFDQNVARLANSKGTYGAVAEEFDRVLRDIEMFGNNLYIGLENLRAVTPSDELRRLVDDLTTILESGGDLTSFLHDEVDRQLESAVAAQEAYVEQLELLSEVFVVGFVAAPLFTLVVLLVISFLGGNLVPTIAVLVYVVIPLGLAGFVVFIDILGQPFAPRSVSTDGDDHTTPEGADQPAWGDTYLQSKRQRRLRKRITERAQRVYNEPWQTIVFTLPIAVLTVAIELRFIPVSVDLLLERPLLVTTELVVVPLVIVLTPVVIAYELGARKRYNMRTRFPNVIELLATSNRRGLPLTRGLTIVSETTTGELSDELERLRNDIKWNADVPAAFAAFGRRLDSPVLARTVYLLAEGSRVTGDLHVVLSVAAKDASERVRLERERKQNLQSYLIIVLVGFLVYLLVVVLLSENFLAPIERFSVGASVTSEAPISLGAIPVDQLRMLLFHSVLIQGFGSGLLAGKLVDNTLYSGLKYGLVLVVLSTIVFASV